jgi:hypothetical protein
MNWKISKEYMDRYHPVWTAASERLPDPSKKVLAFYRNSLGNGRIVVADWVPANTVQDACEEDFAEYNEELDDYFWAEGWYEQIENWDEYGAFRITEGEVTHWMPLPEGPK